MTTVINNPSQPTEGSGNSGNTGNMIAVLVLVILVILFFVYGLPAIRRSSTDVQPNSQNMETEIIQEQPGATSPVDSPEPTSGSMQIDLNINETSPEPETTEEVMDTTEPSPTE